MREFFSKMLSSDEKVSSKRVITFLASILVFVVVVVDLFTDKTVTEYVFEGLIWMAIAGLGSTALESFSKRAPKTPPMDPYGPYNNYNNYGYGTYPSYGGYASNTPDPEEPNPNPKPDVIV